MRKFALAMMAASAAVFGFGMVAEAQTYSTSISVGTVTSGGGYTATYTNCVPGETITFSQPESTPTTTTGVCMAASSLTVGSVIGFLLPAQAANGTATGTFTSAPTAAGTYTVTGTGTTSPARTTTFTIQATTTTTAGPTTTAAPGTTVAPTTPVPSAPPTTPGGGLPATGSDGMGTTTGIAIGLLVVGLGLFAVAQVRRRQPSAA